MSLPITPAVLPHWWDRFEAKVQLDPKKGCWLWTASLTKSGGYGQLKVGARPERVHMLTYRTFVGPIPEGMHLDHFACDTPRCVNPYHVRPVTPRENTLRSNSPSSMHAAKTHCPKGHPYAGDNLVIYVSPKGSVARNCRECVRARERARIRVRPSRAKARP